MSILTTQRYSLKKLKPFYTLPAARECVCEHVFQASLAHDNVGWESIWAKMPASKNPVLGWLLEAAFVYTDQNK